MIDLFEEDPKAETVNCSPRDIRAMLERVDLGIGLINDIRQFLVMKLPVPKEAQERLKALRRGYGPFAIDLMRKAIGIPEQVLQLEPETKNLERLMEVTE